MYHITLRIRSQKFRKSAISLDTGAVFFMTWLLLRLCFAPTVL